MKIFLLLQGVLKNVYGHLNFGAKLMSTLEILAVNSIFSAEPTIHIAQGLNYNAQIMCFQ